MTSVKIVFRFSHTLFNDVLCTKSNDLKSVCKYWKEVVLIYLMVHFWHSPEVLRITTINIGYTSTAGTGALYFPNTSLRAALPTQQAAQLRTDMLRPLHNAMHCE